MVLSASALSLVLLLLLFVAVDKLDDDDEVDGFRSSPRAVVGVEAPPVVRVLLLPSDSGGVFAEAALLWPP